MTKYLKIDSPAQKQAKELGSDYKLSNHGLKYLKQKYWNLPMGALYEGLSGVREGEEIVTQGSYLLKTELIKGSIGAGCCEVDPGA